MDGDYGGHYGEYAGAEGGLFVAREFRLSRGTYLALSLMQQVCIRALGIHGTQLRLCQGRRGSAVVLGRPKSHAHACSCLRLRVNTLRCKHIGESRG